MIYATKERAEQVADQLNERRGYARSEAVLTEQGWTVVSPATRTEFPVLCATNHFDVETGETCPRCHRVILRDVHGREINPPEGNHRDGI